MANRSDFFNASLPRYLKRVWSLTKFDDAHEAGAWKRSFIDAHAAHKAAKEKKMSRADFSQIEEADNSIKVE